MKTGVARHATEAKVKVKKRLASGIEEETGRRNERNRFVGFVDINNHPIDAGIKISHLFTARSHYTSALPT